MPLKISRWPLLVGCLAGGLMLLVLFSLLQVWKQRVQDETRAELVGQLGNLRARLESELNAVIHVTDGLVTYIMFNPDLGETEFDAIAAMLMERRPGLISHFTAAPDNVIRYLHPLEGNRAALGLDLMSHPEQSGSVLDMMERRSTVLAGPWELVQGGLRLIIRTPIFVPAHVAGTEDDRYWGLVSIPVDMQRLYEAAGLGYFERSMDIAIRGRDGLGARGETFYGDPALFRRDSLRQTVTMLGGEWELAAEPSGGWPAVTPVGGLWGLIWLITLLTGALAWYLSLQGQRLRQSEVKYRALMENLSDGACIVQDGWLRYVNPRFRDIFGHHEELLLSHQLSDFLIAEDRDQLARLMSRVIADPARPGPLETELRIRTGDAGHSYVRINLSAMAWEDGPAILATVSDIDDRKRLANQLLDSHERLNAIIRALPDIGFIIDDQGQYRDVFGGLDSQLYHRGQALIGKRLHELLPLELADRFLSVVHKALETSSLQTLEYALSAEQISIPPKGGPDGTLWFEGRVMAMGARVFDRPAVIWLAMNVTARKRLEESMRLNARVFEDSNEGIFITDAGNRIISANTAFTRITGYEAAEVIGRNPGLLSSGMHDEAFYQSLWEQVLLHGRWEGEIWNRRKDGRVYPQNLSISVVRDGEGRISHHIAIFSDITRRKEAEAQIRHMALHDNLTGLANRTLLRDRLTQAIEQARRDRNSLALLFIDLDDFKPVNDTHGHEAGDRVLKEVAQRLRAAVRRVDTVARMGGDEFVILLQALEQEDMAIQVAEKIIDSLSRPIQLNGQTCLLGASVGIALHPRHGEDHDGLMRAADQALYQAKSAGKNCYQVAGY